MRIRNIKWTAVLIGFFILIMDGKTAVLGAETGIQICLQTVIPSLFPFIFLSVLLNNFYAGSKTSFLRPLCNFFGIPQGADSLLISSFLGGYPVGAQSVSHAYQKGFLNRSEAEHMLSFCNNIGPAFLFGMLSSFFSNLWMVWILWCIQIISALLVSKIIMHSRESTDLFTKNSPTSVSSALHSALHSTSVICGWVVLFRVLITFADKWLLWSCSTELRTIFLGLLDLTNGCLELPKIANENLRFVICSGMISFGGMCITMQTISVCPGLSLGFYFLGKTLQTVFSILLSLAVVYRNPWLFGGVILFIAAIKRKNKDSFPAPAVV